MLRVRREIVGAHIGYSARHRHMFFLLMTVLLQDLTKNKSSLSVRKDTVTVCQAIVVYFYQVIS